ncbi:MAG: hypothetical protein MJ065_02720 [Oscillospiraceae bacterium]|nr:hypothetical protein [Oscillospiraceae bacterium]
MHTIKDLPEIQRRTLTALRQRPGMYLGTKSLAKLEGFHSGWYCASRSAGIPETAAWLFPLAFNDFAAIRYTGKACTPKNCFRLAAEQEPDDAKAFDLLFALLDEYLTAHGYATIPLHPLPVHPEANDYEHRI